MYKQSLKNHFSSIQFFIQLTISSWKIFALSDAIMEIICTFAHNKKL